MMYSFFFFNDPATTEIYTLSLHDALRSVDPGLDEAKSEEMFGNAKTVHPIIKTGFAEFVKADRKSTRLNSSHTDISRMPSSA